MKYENILILASAIGAIATPIQDVLSASKPRPLVIWHGLGASALFREYPGWMLMSWSPTGDSYDSPGLLKVQSSIAKMHPGIYIHSVYIDPDPKEDKRATFVRSELSSPARFFRRLQLLAY
jgi:palmitoyl-protein thioesterase